MAFAVKVNLIQAGNHNTIWYYDVFEITGILSFFLVTPHIVSRPLMLLLKILVNTH